MDGTRFDALVQQVTAGATRRRLFSGLLGGAALLSGISLADAKRGKGKKKGHGKGKGKGKNNGNGNGKGKGRTKVTLCHNGNLITVGAPGAENGHGKHEDDVICGEAGTCQTGDPTGCDQETGACTFDLAEPGTECTTEDGAAGTCDDAGTCVPTPPVCGAAGDACELSDECCEDLTCESGSCTEG